MLEISEIFYSLQGESTFAGLPCVFVRLSGCNLKCSYCDARYTYEEPGSALSVAAILEQIALYDCSLIEITGGEPLLQPESYLLFQRLIAGSYTVLLETNGSLPLHRVPDQVHIIMDIKCPGSGESAALHPDNLAILAARQARGSAADEIKFVISSEQDYQWAKEMVLTGDLAGSREVLFSPVTGRMHPGSLADLIIHDSLPVRLQLQLHTLLWPESARGK